MPAITPEELEMLQAMLSGGLEGGPRVDPSSVPRLEEAPPEIAPPVKGPGYGYEAAAEALRSQAGELEGQMAPAPGPRGFKENVVSGIQSGLEGFGAGLSGRSYQDVQAQKAAAERQRQQDLVARATALRGEATGQQKMGMDVQESQDTADFRKAQLADSAADRASRENIANREEFTDGPSGVFSKKTGIIKTPAPPKTGGLANLSKDVHVYQGKATDVLVDLDPESPSKGRVFLQTANGLQDITGQTQHYEPPAKYGEPLATYFDTGEGRNVVVPRSDVPKKATAPQPPTVLSKLNEYTAATKRVEDLGAAFNPDFVGPGTSQYLKAKTYLPESVMGIPVASLPEGYGNFSSLQAELKNNMVKLITGAQMHKGEERRILAQIPVETDRGDQWQAKYRQTLRRAHILQSLIDRQVGGSGLTLEDLDKMAETGAMAPAPGPAKPVTGGKPKSDPLGLFK